jgi:hypothetical protein
MKTQVEFRSSKFPPYEGEQKQINPGLWGKRLADYFVRKLFEKGIKTEEIIARTGDGTFRCRMRDLGLLPVVATRTATMMNSSASLIQARPS